MKNRTLKFVVVSVAFLSLTISSIAQDINVNQNAYAPLSLKHAFVPEEYHGKKFKLVEIKTGELVFKGKLSEAKKWSHSGTSVCLVDFSEYNKEGKYSLIIGNGELSREILIENKSQETLAIAALKSYYYARASRELSKKYARVYARPLGHPDNHVKVHASAASKNRPEGNVISSPGGWYDAGDYNKYIVNSGITMHTLLQLYEMFPDYMKELNIDIPESSNDIPDILDEILINLRWMLTMQDPQDGGVYHKLTSKDFCGEVMPHEDISERYVVSKTTSATLDFASVAAKSYRVFSKFEKELPGLADSCLVAAKQAWKWSESHPAVLYVQPKDITTGAYGDLSIQDEKYWAAHELYLSTGHKSFLKSINYENKATAPQWSNVATLGTFSWLGDIQYPDSESLEFQKKILLESAESYYKVYEESAYRVSINSFEWGSNSDIAYQGVLFIHAYVVSGSSKYLQAAEACLNYILGANPLDKCFVTGFGLNRPMNIHDRRSFSDNIEEPIPGLLAGGPNIQAREDCGAESYPSDFPAMSYLDQHCSYSTNEIAINWNASLVFLANALNAIYKENE